VTARPTKRGREIAKLLIRPEGETVEQQKARCAKWAALALARSDDTPKTPYQRAIETEGERHWWRDLGFIILPDGRP
jgi:hypothetical protein